MSVEKEVRTESIGLITKGLWVPDEYRLNKTDFCVPRHYLPLIEDILLTRGQIRDRLEKVAQDIYEHYRDTNEDIVLVVTLKGAVTVFQELSTALRKLSHYDSARGPDRSAYVEQYITCSSYSGMTQGALGVGKELQKIIDYSRGKHVIIVEDMIDTGNTLQRLYEDFSAHTRPQGDSSADKANHILSVRSVVGFTKRTPVWNGFIPDWVGFDLANVWIVGFGCDVDNHFRDLDHLATISAQGKLRYIEN